MAERKAAQRGRSRVRRNTIDMNDERAQVHAPLSEDGSFESSAVVVSSLIETVRRARSMTATAVRYGQGIVTRVAQHAFEALLDWRSGFDHWSGTNDLAGSEIARAAICSKRQWQRVKPQLQRLGLIAYQHRSIATGLAEAAGVDQHLQVSDVYWFSPANLVPWLREIYDAVLAELKARRAAGAKRRGSPIARTPLVKRERPHRRIPALLNPAGWARAVAAQDKALASPSATYAAEEARAVAFATQLALRASSG